MPANPDILSTYRPAPTVLKKRWRFTTKYGPPSVSDGKEYYGCFVRALDGHKIEAMAWPGE